MIKLINLSTYETIDADEDNLRDRGLPEGYMIAEDITIDEWTKLLCGREGHSENKQ